MLSCKELTRMIAADELAEAGFWQRLKARLHLLMCRHCRRYQAQIRALGRATREMWRGGSVGGAAAAGPAAAGGGGVGAGVEGGGVTGGVGGDRTALESLEKRILGEALSSRDGSRDPGSRSDR